MPPKAHAELGASKAKRWMTCPGSIRLSKDIPEPTSKYATEGTGAHAIVERCLERNLDADTFLYLNVEVDEGFVPVTEEMVEAAQVMVDYVMSLITHERDELFIEQQFDLAPLNPPGPMFGTGDAVVWQHAESHLHIVDYKHGVGVAVDAEENPQLMMYALGALVEIRKVPKHITVTIVQPRGFHPAGPVRSYTFDMDRMKAFRAELFAAAEKTKEEDAPLCAGDHCRFCPALAVCPEQLKTAVEVAQVEFDCEAPIASDDLPEPEALSIEQIAFVCEKSEVVMDWLKAVFAHATAMADRGDEVPGFKLVAGRMGNRKWADLEAAEKYLKNRKLKVAERFKKVLISPTQAAKQLKKKGGKELPDHLFSRSEGRPKLVPAADARPAITASAQSDFDIPPESTTTVETETTDHE